MHRAATMAEVRALLAADERVTYSISDQLLQHKEGEQKEKKEKEKGAEPRRPKGSHQTSKAPAPPENGATESDRTLRRGANNDDTKKKKQQQQSQQQSQHSQQREGRHRSPAPPPATVQQQQQQQAEQARGGVTQEEAARPHSCMKDNTRSPKRMSPRPRSSLARAPEPKHRQPQPQPQQQQKQTQKQHHQQQHQQHQQQRGRASAPIKTPRASTHGQASRRLVSRRKQPPQRKMSLSTSPCIPSHVSGVQRSNSVTEMRQLRGQLRSRRRSSFVQSTDREQMLQQSLEARHTKHEAIRAFLTKRMEDASVFVTTKLSDPRLRRHILSLVHRDAQHVGKAVGGNTSPGSGLSNEQLRKDCSDLVASIMEIYERDFVTLCHGHRGVVFAEPHPIAIRFLLTGIGLAILYESIPPKSEALEKLAHETLIIISARDTWIRALQLFGPVPVHRLQQQQRDVTKRSRTVRLNKPESSSPMRDRSPSAYRLAAAERDVAIHKALSEAAACPECHRQIPRPPAHAALIRCSNCGVQVIRYFVDLVNDLRTALEHVIVQAELPPRMRTVSF